MNVLFMSAVAKLPKWSLPIIMVVPACTLLIVGVNKEPIHVYSEQIQEITIGANEIGVMRDRDFTLCEERGGIVGKSGCFLQFALVTGRHRIPITYDVEIVDTRVQTWEFKVEGWKNDTN